MPRAWRRRARRADRRHRRRGLRAADGASKFAQAGFLEALRIEAEDDGIAVTVVFPGVVATEIRRHGWPAARVVMTRKARAGMWMKLLAPRVVDRMTRAALAKDPASRRPVRQ